MRIYKSGRRIICQYLWIESDDLQMSCILFYVSVSVDMSTITFSSMKSNFPVSKYRMFAKLHQRLIELLHFSPKKFSIDVRPLD